MKQFRIFILAIVGCIMLTACPGGGGTVTPEEIPGNEYTDTYNIPANGCDETYTLSKLSTELSSVSSCPEWLSVSILTYSYGSPKIKIIAKANTDTSERKHVIVIQSTNNDKLTLTIVQAGKEKAPSGIDDIHNGTSTNPAYSKSR